MTDYDWPTTLAPVDSTFYLQSHTKRFESSFTRQTQTLGLSAPRWVASMTFSPVGNDTKAGAMDALIIKLKGGQNRIKLFDWRRRTGNGSWASHDTYAAGLSEPTTFTDGTDFTDTTGLTVSGDGSPRHLGTTSGMTSIGVEGFSPDGIQIKAGDYIGFGDNRAYMCVEDFTPDANGEGTITFEPALRATMTAAALDNTDVGAYFRLTSDDAGNNPSDARKLTSYSLDFVEDL